MSTATVIALSATVTVTALRCVAVTDVTLEGGLASFQLHIQGWLLPHIFCRSSNVHM